MTNLNRAGAVHAAAFLTAIFLTSDARAGTWHLEASGQLLTEAESRDESGLQEPRGSRILIARDETLGTALAAGVALRSRYEIAPALSVFAGVQWQQSDDVDLDGDYLFSNGDYQHLPQSVKRVRTTQVTLGVLKRWPLADGTALEVQADLRHRDRDYYQVLSTLFGAPDLYVTTEDSSKGVGARAALTQDLGKAWQLVFGIDAARTGEFTVLSADAGLRWRLF
jgi:hypothetical protein